MEFDELINNINDLKLSHDNTRTQEKKILIIESFNKLNEQKFKFQCKNKQNHENLGKFVLETLLESNSLLDEIDNSNDILPSTNPNLLCACLDLIRLISRDINLVDTFHNDQLLNHIQQLANLDPCKLKQPDNLMVTFNALKAMSNLIYNSKYVQDYYATNGVAETITIHLKQFTPADLTSSESPSFKILLFNLKISFLLTVFNKSLRLKLREKLQIITYLIEIIDQIMKERLNNETDVSDFCFLKRVDVDFIIEILKILYNLTMDIQTDRQTTNKSNYLIEEEEAHLMHLVSVLRDLITCKLEGEIDVTWSKIGLNSKLNDLHSNIINLLTNMPTLCYEELLAPCTPMSAFVQNENSLSKFNARYEHNKKRMSRRSKLIKAREENKIAKKSNQNIQHANDDFGIDLGNFVFLLFIYRIDSNNSDFFHARTSLISGVHA